MLVRKRRRKLLYPGGLISLSLLPFLFFASNEQYFLREPLHVLEVTYWDPADLPNSPNLVKYVNEKFTKIVLTGGLDDKIKLDYAQIAILELMQQTDTTLGIEFTFKKQAKYSSLVKLFDLCQIEGVRSHANFEDKFWVYNLWPDKSRFRIAPLRGLCYVISDYPAETTFPISILAARPIVAILSLTLFVVMICLAGRGIVLHQTAPYGKPPDQPA